MSAILVFGEGLVSGGANVPQSLGYVDLVRGQASNSVLSSSSASGLFQCPPRK